MTNKEFRQFLTWIRNRLVYKYHEKDPTIITALNCLINNHYFIVNTLLKDKDLTRVCQKYYADFDYEKDSPDDTLNIGYTNDEKRKIKDFIQSLGKDIMEIYTS